MAQEPPPDAGRNRGPAGPHTVRIAAAALLRAGPGGPQVLVSRRHPNAVRGGLWEFPGGKLEAGEDAPLAASRELREETGVLVDPRCGRELGSAGHHDPALARERRVEIVLVRFTCPEGASPRPLASAECRWESVDALDRLEWPPANRMLIELLRADLAARPLT